MKRLFFALILYVFCLTQAAFAQSVGPLFTEFLLFDQSIGGASNPVNLAARWQVAQITAGGTFNSGTFHVQISGDGVTYANADCYSADGVTQFSSNGWITAAGVWRCNVSGATFMRAVRSSGSGGTTRITATASTIGNTTPVGSVGSLNPLTDPIPSVTLYDGATTPVSNSSRFVGGYQLVLLTATGTFSGATFGIQTSNDNVNFAATDCYALTGGAALTSTTWLNATGVFRCNISGASWLRARVGSGTPGNMKISAQLSLIGFSKAPGAGGAAAGIAFADISGIASDAQIPDLNTLSTGLTATRCVQTDASGLLGVAAGTCSTGGSVTSVGLTAPAQFSITGTPVTTSGTLAIAWQNQTANFGLFGPTTGAAAAPTFRALVTADLPAISFSTITSGTNTGMVGVVGTGASLGTSGSGTIAATTAAALAANGGNCATGSAAAGVDAAGAAETCTDYMEEPTTTGLVVKTAANTPTTRDVTGSGGIVITNGAPAGFAGNINVGVSANVPSLTPTINTFPRGNGSAWVTSTATNCPNTGGNVTQYNSATGNFDCNVGSGGSGISGLNTNIVPVATSATSIADSSSPQIKTNAGVLEIGNVATNSWDLDPSAITGHKTQVLQNIADTFVYRTTSDTLTNKTLDAEGTGNVITIPFKRWISVAACIAGVASHVLDAPSSNAPAPTCDSADPNMGTLDFDDTTDESVEFTDRLASDWTGAIDVVFVWKGAATSGAVGWCLQVARTPDGATSSISFVAQGAGNCVSDTAKGTTLQENQATISGVTCTSCAAGDRLKWRISRDANGGAVTDSFVGDAKLIGIELTYRRAM